MIKFIEIKFFNTKLFLGTVDNELVWADWNAPQGVKDPKNSFLLSVQKELLEYQEGKRVKFNFKLNPSGTEFQKKVWSELRKIPWGKTVSYSDVALKLGSPQSVRAVASAIGKNPICVFIPCHRVIAKDGTLGGFSGGLPVKISLLKREGHNF